MIATVTFSSATSLLRADTLLPFYAGRFTQISQVIRLMAASFHRLYAALRFRADML
jgi:hypothetical protein